jgi:hypothetical protein
MWIFANDSFKFYFCELLEIKFENMGSSKKWASFGQRLINYFPNLITIKINWYQFYSNTLKYSTVLLIFDSIFDSI